MALVGVDRPVKVDGLGELQSDSVIFTGRSFDHLGEFLLDFDPGYLHNHYSCSSDLLHVTIHNLDLRNETSHRAAPTL